MRTQEVRADSLTTRDSLVESPETGRRQTLKISEFRQHDKTISLRVRLSDNIVSREFQEGDTVTIIKRVKKSHA